MGASPGVVVAVSIGSVFAISLLLIVIYCFIKIKEHERNSLPDESKIDPPHIVTIKKKSSLQPELSTKRKPLNNLI